MFYNIENIARESKFTKRFEARKCIDFCSTSPITILFAWSTKDSCSPECNEPPKRHILFYWSAEAGLGKVKVKTWSWKFVSSPPKAIGRVKCEQ